MFLVSIETFSKFFRNFPKRFNHNQVFDMRKAYLRHLGAQDRFEISFHFEHPSVKVNRQFNFCRSLDETISAFTSRVALNIEKLVKKKTKLQNGDPVLVHLTVDDVKVEEGLCKDVFVGGRKVGLNVNEASYEVVVNSPWIGALGLPSSIMANFPVYPNKFESVHTDRTLSEFKWFKSRDKSEWAQVGTSFVYQPGNGDVDFFLKVSCLPKNGEGEGPLAEAVSGVKVEAGPGECPFEVRHRFTQDKCNGDSFRVVTYNILADLYCDSDYTRQVLHPYCPPYALSLDYRKQLIVKELLGYNADIICLQEVDKKVFNHDLKFIFDGLGFGADFCVKRKLVAEGLACFYDKNRFKLLESHRFLLSEELESNELFSGIWEKIKAKENLRARILDRSTVLQAVVLESVDRGGDVLVVANTHLYFHPDADHIRLLQGGVVIKFVEDLVGKLKNQLTDKRVSVIFCGDFNSVPECGIYQLFTEGSVREDHVDFQSNAEQAISGVSLRQNIPLKSACGTPQFTNFTAEFQACLDYIFHDRENLEVVQVVPLPAVEELNRHTALPSVVFPSDHLSLVSDLKFK